VPLRVINLLQIGVLIVLAKRPNKGRQLPAEVVEGRALPKGNSR
jgi:hypothetical protein